MSDRREPLPGLPDSALNRRHGAIEKLRLLVTHPRTEEMLRAIARERLDILAPRRAMSPPGAPRRRVTDRPAAPPAGLGRLVLAAYAVGTAPAAPSPRAASPDATGILPEIDLLA
ncbi:hypothetical protein [Paracraurococcus ruber]|uniref:Uncharacterized protein n=1 Tax=Paracraurococcus ruber TaxID=77675 RepID=A0ABS1D2G1_9PROT|nr:hypothetical protein [Paracraurococcus ruber]MBK1660681.1 hypothetical protein [Paracraurococcus ruber]TDG27204.1 hypothetical protein E2C05_23745 [Paracraurococcus ruber]